MDNLLQQSLARTHDEWCAGNGSTGLLPGSNYGINCMDNFRENIALNNKNNIINDLKKIKAQMKMNFVTRV